VLSLLLVFILSARAPLDTDMWWHLRAGETMLASGKPLLIDTFSFTRTGASWMNHSWLAQVGMALGFRELGFGGLALGVSLTACATMVLVWFQLKGNALIKAIWLVICAFFCSLVWAPRPQILSLMFLAGLDVLINYSRQRNRKILWAIVPLFALWSNIHAGYSLGLILIAAYIAGDIYDWLTRGIGIKETGNLVVWAALGVFSTLVNPNGINTWRVLFETVDVQALQQFISEWASPDFHDFPQLLFLLFFMSCLFIFFQQKQGLSGEQLAKLIAFGLLAFYARRNIAPFAVIIVPLAANSFDLILQNLITPNSPLEKMTEPAAQWFKWANREEQPILIRLRKGINLFLVAVLFLAGIGKLYAVTQPLMMSRYLNDTYPVKGMAWLSENLSEGNLLNEYEWGGYLLWSYPTTPVFVDGRTDLYGDEILGDWITLVQAGDNYQQLLNRYKITTVMLRPSRPLVKLLALENWKIAYQDKQVVILRR